MLTTKLLLWVAVALTVHTLPEAVSPALQFRQDNQNPPSSVAPPNASPAPSSSNAPSPQTSSDQNNPAQQSDNSQPPVTSSGPSSSAASSTANTFATSTVVTLSNATSSIPSVTATPSPAANSTSPDTAAQLPFQPEITPALGVAGVLLIIAGAAYTFVGIKSKVLHIALSTAYLVALAITVLLVYVCNPPISNGIQGAYLVAAVVPACIIAGLALIFADLLGGLGCVLGGFCLGMWFLTLQPGGLVTSEGGRVGLIIGFTAAGTVLWFSHYTRTYGLIACISFAGATSLILGIDCFSRSGLKEFWVYLWNLNSKIFPLDTKTYPITRGMKVEIALIVIVACFGILSQLKIWKIIRERREKKEAARAQDDEARDHLEVDMGRQIEERNNMERAHWEAIHGNKGFAASTIGSTTAASTKDSDYYHPEKSSMSIKETASVVEMTDMSNRHSAGTDSNRRTSKDRPTIRIDAVDDHDVGSSSPTKIEDTLRALEPVTEHPSRSPSMRSYVMSDKDDEGRWEQRSMAHRSEPVVEPLPFTVPTENAETKDREDDVQSLATAGETIYDNRPHNRIAGRRILRRDSAGLSTSAFDETDNGLGLNIPHFDDKRSSLAATIDGMTNDDDMSLPNLSRPTSPFKDPEDIALPRPRSMANMEEVAAASAPSMQVTSNKRKSMPSLVKDDIPTVKAMVTENDDKSSANLTRQTSVLKKELLPTGQSSTVQLYRTNEWAKHQAVAEKPEVDQVAPPSETGVGVTVGPQEASAPVDSELIRHSSLQSPSTRQSPTSNRVSTNPYRKTSNGVSNPSSPHTPPEQQSRGSVPRSISNPSPYLQPQVQRSGSQTSLTSPRHNVYRSSSSPAGALPNLRTGSSNNLLTQTLVESPIEDVENADAVSPLNNYLTSPAMSSNPYANNSLMNKRQDMLAGRMSSMSFANPDVVNSTTQLSRSPSLQGTSPPANASDDNISLSSRRHQLVEEDENMTLAQRRELIQQQQQNPRSRALSSSQASPNGPTTSSRAIYDSHQPQRGTSVTAATRDNRLASWRASMATDNNRRVSTLPQGLPAGSNIHTALAAVDGSRATLMDTQRRAKAVHERREQESRARDAAMDRGMRQGNMIELHRAALKRMQSQTEK